ncbi:MAG: hypothetical protein WKF47_02795 [Geodermatophilaceae bacterium]
MQRRQSWWTDIAKRYWHRAGVGGLIELTLGPALDTLRSLPLDPAYELAFVDADKVEYPAYVEELYPRIRTRRSPRDRQHLA